MEPLKHEILNQLRDSLQRLATQLEDQPALANAILAERDRVPQPASVQRPVRSRSLRRAPISDLLYLALAHAELPYPRFDAIRLRTDRARRVRRERRTRAA